MNKQVLAVVAASLFGQVTVAFAQTQTRSMSFEACLATIRTTADNLGVAPINIVETNVMRVVRFLTSDGSVLLTCSKPDNKLIITKSN